MIVLIRADADGQIGSGHWMRCLALAQACRDSGDQVVLSAASRVPSLEGRWAAEGVEIVRNPAARGSLRDAEHLAVLARHRCSSWIVLDGYAFGQEYQRAVKESGRQILLVDDVGGQKEYSTDVILNQNIHASEDLYRGRASSSRLLLGLRYTLLRREFRSRARPSRNGSRRRRILVTLGGGDPDNVTLKVIRALQGLGREDVEVKVVVGGAHPDPQGLAAAVAGGRVPMTLERHVTDMPGLMAWADLAVTGSGSTCWELAFMGLPSLLLVLADNQRELARGMDQRGAALNLGWHRSVSRKDIRQGVEGLLLSPERRAAMAARGRKLVDGRGALRVLSFMKKHSRPGPGKRS